MNANDTTVSGQLLKDLTLVTSRHSSQWQPSFAVIICVSSAVHSPLSYLLLGWNSLAITLLYIFNRKHEEQSNTRLYTLSGRIGKVVASPAAVALSSPAEVVLIYTMHVVLRGYCP